MDVLIWRRKTREREATHFTPSPTLGGLAATYTLWPMEAKPTAFHQINRNKAHKRYPLLVDEWLS